MMEKKVDLLKKCALFFLIVLMLFFVTIIVKEKTKDRVFAKALVPKQYLLCQYQEAVNHLFQKGENMIELRIDGNFLQAMNEESHQDTQDIVLEGNVLRKDSDFDVSFLVKLGETILQSGEMVKNKDAYAMSFPFLFQEFVAFHHQNSQMVAKDLGLIPETTADEEEAFLEQGVHLFEKYLAIALKSVKHRITIDGSYPITIGKKDFKTKQLQLTLSKRDMVRIYEDVLKEIKDDDEAIQYIASLGVKTASQEITMTTEQVKQELKNSFSKAYERAQNDMTNYSDESILTISLYTYHGKTIKTVFEIHYQNEITYSLETIEDYLRFEMAVDNIKNTYCFSGEKQKEKYIGDFSLMTSGLTVGIFQLQIQYPSQTKRAIRNIDTMDVLWLDEDTKKNVITVKEQLDRSFGKE